ncbi:AAA family ATPase [Colwellia sp. MB02u-18]|uniref:AAA family ATPase n=1 Tax=unclassified Colwellia TaxID=196834 RepID=UPI0015F3FD2B|nr:MULTISPECIES: AAA family ATPase [unclassified Colwellia]MBA6223256.1 AAA family ATPase [Colwellia sp. MB3u-45]MBA6267778.1 AAA family ATPase [Colwellia sp. MB3u-43]MBA6322415.1 AAA family ATPase [Colwellia sp. MB02u-19]MBA6324414.1 AAA family ATPase [Colwellia sp. MB02u-18]MBA6332570.1 AAA family ATPase [Colwellia sp. MB02u-12]
MYTSYFGLEEKPFSIAPNPDYLFMSDRHREALNHLTYGLGDTGGFVLLTGEVGTGKTTLSRHLMANLPENTQAAFILNPTLSSQELLATLCDELNIRYRKTGATLKTLTDKIQQKLLKNHSDDLNTLLIIDEAQHLQPEVLEQLRLLTNLETNTKKLLQVILIGQPELQQLLQRRDLRQLAQRITARYHLLPLNRQEVEQYLKHRLSVAKCFRNIFDKSAVSAIHKICNGIPRLMNLLAERSLINAYNSNNAVVNRKIVLQAAHDALGDEFQVRPWWQHSSVKAGGLVTALGLVLALGVWWGAYQAQGIVLETKVTRAVINKANPITEQEPLVDREAPAVVTTALAQADAGTSNDINSGTNNGTNLLALAVDQTTQAKASNTKLENDLAVATSKTVSRQAGLTDEQGDTEQYIASESSLADAQIDLPTSAQKSALKPKKVTGENFVVKAEAGVSDELLASFQSAIEHTKQSDPAREDVVAGSSELIPLAQMPTWVQDGVPSLAFEMHLYASDGQGWVRVNGRDRYEGDYISRELLLNEILPQRVVLSFRGEKFTMSALSTWN